MLVTEGSQCTKSEYVAVVPDNDNVGELLDINAYLSTDPAVTCVMGIVSVETPSACPLMDNMTTTNARNRIALFIR